MKKELLVDVWSDVACPWCFVGKRRLEGALDKFAHKADVKVTWHAFELDPGAPPVRPNDVSHTERLAKKYGMSVAQAEAATKNLVDTASKDGITMRFDRIRGGNTFDAHRVIHLAGERGLQDAVKERLLVAYFTEGASVGEPEVLVRLASEAGLDADEVRAMLASDALTDAQPVDVLLQALTKGWDAATEKAASAEGAVCGPEGCA